MFLFKLIHGEPEIRKDRSYVHRHGKCIIIFIFWCLRGLALTENGEDVKDSTKPFRKSGTDVLMGCHWVNFP